MHINPKDLRAAGVDPKAWAQVARNPYGWNKPLGQHRPRSVVLRGGPLADSLVSMHAPESGTLPLRGGRYVWQGIGRLADGVGYLQWEVTP